MATLRSVYEVELIVDTPIEAVQRHLGPWGHASKQNATTTRIKMNIPDLGWAVTMLAVLNANIRHVEPAELCTLLHQLADRFHSATTLPIGASDPEHRRSSNGLRRTTALT